MKTKVFAGSAPNVEDQANNWLDKNVNCEPPKAVMLPETLRLNAGATAVILAFFYEEVKPV